MVVKFYFLLINAEFIGTDLASFPEIWWEGLQMDVSIVGYFSIIPLLLLLINNWWPKTLSVITKVYWGVVWLFAILTVAVDPYFFKYWGQKTNLGFTQFLGKENAGLLSIEWTTYAVALGFMIITTIWFFRRGISHLSVPEKSNWLIAIVLIAISGLMLRGSVDKVPINVSSAYFSSNNLYNNTAVNSIWSFLATEFERGSQEALSFFETREEAEKILQENTVEASADFSKLIKDTKEKNVILIILESFSAKTVGFLSGEKYGSTPKLDNILENGIAYTNVYAASFRSDKGLLALTTGIPSSARQTLTNFPEKLAHKPNIFEVLADDYTTGFYYGGNMEFANIKVLFKDADVRKGQDDFGSTKANAWGVHDEEVFDVFTKDFLRESKPQFKMLFSLSSHEPFDVPNFKKKNSPYLNSIAYTDSCLGVMMSALRASEKWKNTLVIITADHGSILPDKAPIFDTANFKIPLVLTGGVVQRDTVITDIVSQSDIAATISQYAIGENVFPQKTLFTPSNKAYYSYHNGLTYVSDTCVQSYNLDYKKYMNPECTQPFEKAYYQLANDDFFNH